MTNFNVLCTTNLIVVQFWQDPLQLAHQWNYPYCLDKLQKNLIPLLPMDLKTFLQLTWIFGIIHGKHPLLTNIHGTRNLAMHPMHWSIEKTNNYLILFLDNKKGIVWVTSHLKCSLIISHIFVSMPKSLNILK